MREREKERERESNQKIRYLHCVHHFLFLNKNLDHISFCGMTYEFITHMPNILVATISV